MSQDWTAEISMVLQQLENLSREDKRTVLREVLGVLDDEEYNEATCCHGVHISEHCMECENIPEERAPAI